MSADLKAKLAQVAARIAATQERLRGLERSAASVRLDLERLRAEVEPEPGAVPSDDEFGARVPTRPLPLATDGATATATAAETPAGAPADGKVPGDR